MTDDLTELAGTIAGPPDTPYAGGKFRSVIKLSHILNFLFILTGSQQSQICSKCKLQGLSLVPKKLFDLFFEISLSLNNKELRVPVSVPVGTKNGKEVCSFFPSHKYRYWYSYSLRTGT